MFHLGLEECPAIYSQLTLSLSLLGVCLFAIMARICKERYGSK